MMKNILFCIFALLLACSSCKDNGKNPLLPTVTGAAYDMLIVGDPTVWKDSAGQYLFNLLDEDTPGLPQSEPMFNISYIPESQFDRVLKPARNIVMYNVDDKMYTQGKVTYLKNRWAQVQAIVQITAPDQAEMIKVLREKQQEIIDFFVNTEYTRTLTYYKRYANGEKKQLVKDSVGIFLFIPDFLNKSQGAHNFVWLSNGSLDSRHDIVAYRTPYTGPDDFKLERLIATRDSVMKCHIEGPSEGSYMATEVTNYQPVCREFMVDNRYCVEMRGLWRVQGDMMGGPFTSRSYYDKEHQEIVTVEAFVYAPQHKKRNKIRLLEAIVSSVQFK